MSLVRRCTQSLMLPGAIECCYVFDRTSHRTGLNQLNITAPYSAFLSSSVPFSWTLGQAAAGLLCLYWMHR